MTTEPVLDAPTITVNGTTYHRAEASSEVRIVILQRGWVVVGRWSQDGEMVTLSDASVIRRWGTTKGLGELTGGPKSGTTIDPAGTVRFHVLTMVQSIDCEPGSWA